MTDFTLEILNHQFQLAMWNKEEREFRRRRRWWFRLFGRRVSLS